MGFPQTEFGSLVQVLYDMEESISRGLWADFSPLDSKGKKPGSGPRSSDIGAIGISSHSLQIFLTRWYNRINTDQLVPIG